MNNEESEIITLVDEYDNVIGESNRAFMMLNNLIHRCSYIFVFNSKTKKFLIQRRSLSKKYCPGYLDLCFGGVVKSGETYDQNSHRELKEEIGIDSITGNSLGIGMQSLFKFYHEDNLSRCWGQVYLYYTEQNEFEKQDEEVEQIYYYSIQEILKLNENITPDSSKAFKQLLQYHSHMLE